MRDNAKFGVVSHSIVAIAVAGAMAASTALPAVAYATDGMNIPSVGVPEGVDYERLTPEEVAAFYDGNDSPDLSEYYVAIAVPNGMFMHLEFLPYDDGAAITDFTFGPAYEGHELDPALFVRTVNTQTGSGTTDLTMILEDTREHGGIADDPTNPDGDPLDPSTQDGLGDNLAFTVPSSINYVVKADGNLIGPDAGVAFIENRSSFKTFVSSVGVEPGTDAGAAFNIVDDVDSQENAAVENAVQLSIGPASGQINAADYLIDESNGISKVALSDATAWNMAATNGEHTSVSDRSDEVLLASSGKVARISNDITHTTRFGTIHWYLTPGESLPQVTVLVDQWTNDGYKLPSITHHVTPVSIPATLPESTPLNSIFDTFYAVWHVRAVDDMPADGYPRVLGNLEYDASTECTTLGEAATLAGGMQGLTSGDYVLIGLMSRD